MAGEHPQDNVETVIVGAGPVGSVLALELARYGVRSIVLERAARPSRHPKMDYISGRSMELLRRLGLASILRERGVDPQHASNFIWSRSLAEDPVTVWQYPSPADLADRFHTTNDGSAPVETYMRVQGSLLEEIIRERVREHPLIDLREGWVAGGLREHPEHVTVSAVSSAAGARRSVAAAYLVACDGANSAIRSMVGIGTHAFAPPTSHCSVYFRSSDPALRKYGRAFVTIFATGLTLVSRDEADTWSASFIVPDGTMPDDPVGEVQKRLGARIDVDDVLSLARWQGALSVSDRYRRGRVLFAGDAAHQFYPTGGLGANTGIGDAVDLGWKLSAVVNGWGGERLLDGYESEQRPVALFNRHMSANLLDVWRRFPQLVAEGAPSEHVAGFLEQQTYQLDNAGIHFDYRYHDSPLVRHASGPAPMWNWHQPLSTVWPGARAPSVRLSDGSELFDLLGVGFTLVDTTGRGEGVPMERLATSRGIPMSYLAVTDDAVRAVWGRGLTVVRPDQHVAWCSDRAPQDASAVLAHVTGASLR